ncbi:MAG: triose-phosphate isomerase [Oscillospiraceae bacterium]|jgi:triosephosphate isomerase|nr:triose-phosphate isomerase [Oscillospiraceae bacterium]
MNKATRKPVIAGNWKMNKTRAETKELITALVPLAKGKDNVTVVIGVPFTDIETAVALTVGTNINVAAQNVHFEKSGAFTGEISADMLVESGVKYVIIGHSERRQYFGETDETVNKRTKAALAAGLIPILCIGEYLSEREADITDEVIIKQVKLDLAGLSKEDVAKTIIAYEPVWAIGTGKTATPEQAESVHEVIRTAITKLYDADTAAKVVIQYGGSMNAKNAADLLAKPDIDGGLIGGASLKAEDFSVIINAADIG